LNRFEATIAIVVLLATLAMGWMSDGF